MNRKTRRKGSVGRTPAKTDFYLTIIFLSVIAGTAVLGISEVTKLLTSCDFGSSESAAAVLLHM